MRWLQTTTCRCTPETRPAELQLIRRKNEAEIEEKERKQQETKHTEWP